MGRYERSLTLHKAISQGTDRESISMVNLGEDNFPKNCKSNSNLSYSKMLYEENLRHVRQLKRENN